MLRIASRSASPPIFVARAISAISAALLTARIPFRIGDRSSFERRRARFQQVAEVSLLADVGHPTDLAAASAVRRAVRLSLALGRRERHVDRLRGRPRLEVRRELVGRLDFVHARDRSGLRRIVRREEVALHGRAARVLLRRRNAFLRGAVHEQQRLRRDDAREVEEFVRLPEDGRRVNAWQPLHECHGLRPDGLHARATRRELLLGKFAVNARPACAEPRLSSAFALRAAVGRSAARRTLATRTAVIKRPVMAGPLEDARASGIAAPS